MSVIAAFRFVNSTGLKGDASAYSGTTAFQGYYPVARKTSGLITVTTNSAGLAAASSQYALNAPGEWLIIANGQFASGASTIKICRNGIAIPTNQMAGSGSVAQPNVTIQRTFSVGDTILTQVTPNGAMTNGDDLNFISFAYLGPV
jgi:hypothetical protein